MSTIKQIIKTEIRVYTYLRNSFKEQLEDLPAGSISVEKRGEHKYLHYNNAGRSSHLSMRRPDDISLARKLRRKQFLKKSIRILSNDIAVLSKALDKLLDYDPKSISDSLSSGYSIIPSRENEVLSGFDPHTHDFYNFRSKSEEIIALILEANGLLYAYETQLIAAGKSYKPDFIIFDPRTNTMVIWEHLGLLDKDDYYRKNIQKLMDYWAEGYILGRNLIISCETSDKPLTAADVQAIVDFFFFQ